MARTLPGGQDRAGGDFARRSDGCRDRAIAMELAPPARRRSAHAFYGAVGLTCAHRLYRARGTQVVDPCAGAVWPRSSSHDRAWPGTAGDRAAIARPPAGPSHARPAGLLAWQLCGGESRDARALPAPSLAG